MITPEQILNAKILILEDDKASRLLLKSILQTSGFQNIHGLPNATRISNVYRSFKPDLLVLDLNMPRISGFDVMARLRRDYPDDYLPIVIISADSEDSIHLRALSAGAKDFLNKPYDRAKVIMRCRNIIETNLLHNAVKAQNVNLAQIIHERTAELHQSRLDVIRRLGYAAEYRDTDTGDHIVRMSRYCERLARALGMNEEECELILATSPLHDVGKIAIPDSILLKPGALTPEEIVVMHTHAEIGAEILSGGTSPFLKMAETVALTHHERWDGKGYPHGLKGEEIPLVGRICAISDIFDALTSERPYKKAWTFDASVKELKRMRGYHFDPKVLDAFINVIPDIKAISRDVNMPPHRPSRRQRVSLADSR
ncbi:MAG: response regulator [Candidatus Omnitrophica bacterium]|nr:response regulator [Candidatus Omnitrophota bacterium]